MSIDRNRRTLLRKVGVAGIATTTGFLATGSQTASAAEECGSCSGPPEYGNELDPVWTSEEHASTTFNSCGDRYPVDRTRLASSLTYWGSQYNPNNQQWTHQFTTAAVAENHRKDANCNDDWSCSDEVHVHEFWLDNRYPSDTHVPVPTVDRAFGVTPAPDSASNPDYGDIAFTAIKTAISAFGKKGTAAALLLGALKNDGTKHDEGGQDLKYRWLSGAPCASHFLDFDVIGDGKQAGGDVNFRLACSAGGGGGYVEVEDIVAFVNPTCPPDQTCPNQTTEPTVIKPTGEDKYRETSGNRTVEIDRIVEKVDGGTGTNVRTVNASNLPEGFQFSGDREEVEFKRFPYTNITRTYVGDYVN